MTIYFLKFPLVPTLGGAELHTLKLAKHFSSQGHEIKLITSDQHLFRLFEKNKLPRKRLFLGWEPTAKWSILLWPVTWLLARSRLRKIIRRGPPDSIFFCQSLIEKLILPSLLTTYNLQLTTVFLEHKIPGRWLKSSPLKSLYIKYAKKLHLITVSNFAKQEFINLGIPEKNLTTIYPSVDPVIARVSPKQSQFTIGILGRLDPEKGVVSFLNSIETTLTKHPNWQILIGGEGAQRPEIEKFSEKNPQVNLLGFVYNLNEFFSKISVLAYPTLVPESFGLAILEAMSRGIPVIATDLGAIPEILSEKSEGMLIDSSNEWVSTFETLEDPKYYVLSSSAALRRAQDFSETKMLQEFDKLIQLKSINNLF